MQLEQGMSYNVTYFVEYMNTYADILYAYGAYVHGSQYSSRSQIRLIARLQSGNGTMYCSSGSTTQRLSLDLIHSMPLDPSSHCPGIRVLCPFMLLDTHWRHTRKRRTPIQDDLINVECRQQWPELATDEDGL